MGVAKCDSMAGGKIDECCSMPDDIGREFADGYNWYLMGVVVEKVSKHPTELVLLGGLAATFYRLNQQRREKD